MTIKKPKILFVLSLPPPVHGAAMMCQYIYNSDLINNNFDCDYINLQTSKKLTETGRGFFSKLFTILGLYRKVFSSLVKSRYDLCYMSITANGAGFYKDVVVVLIMKIFGCKIIYHFQNKGVSHSKGLANHLIYKFIFKNTKSILLSSYLYPDIKKYVKEDKVFYCPNAGTDLAEDFNSDEIKDKITGEDRPCKLIFLSNMMKEKGVLVLLDACNVLKQKKINFECHFVGAWSDVTELYFMQKVDEYGLNSVVFTHGARYGQEKLSFLKNADIFVFPTFYHYEAFPLVTLEAMQHGLPVISTPEGGIREIVIEGETGFLVPQHNILELAEKIEVLINDPELRIKMGLAGRNRFMRKFTLNEFENRIATILKEVTVS